MLVVVFGVRADMLRGLTPCVKYILEHRVARGWFPANPKRVPKTKEAEKSEQR